MSYCFPKQRFFFFFCYFMWNGGWGGVSREMRSLKKKQVVGIISWKTIQHRWKHGSHHSNAPAQSPKWSHLAQQQWYLRGSHCWFLTAVLMESKNNFGWIRVFFRKNERRGVHILSYFQEWESDVGLTRDMHILVLDRIPNSICGNRQHNSILDALWRTKRGAVWG